MAAASDFVWQARVEEALSGDPELSVHLGEHCWSPRQQYFVLRAAEEMKHAPYYATEKERVDDFYARKFFELRRLGDVDGEGTSEAKFKPFINDNFNQRPFNVFN